MTVAIIIHLCISKGFESLNSSSLLLLICCWWERVDADRTKIPVRIQLTILSSQNESFVNEKKIYCSSLFRLGNLRFFLSPSLLVN